MKKYERGEIAEVVLSVLLVAGVIAVGATMPNAVQLFKYFTPRNARERERVKQSVFRLEKKGLIKRKDTAEDGFVLTTKGEEIAARIKLKSMSIVRQKKWDGKWRLVMFDVPENKRRARLSINGMLKKIGCMQYQKSVFITPFPCKKEIDFVGQCFGVRQNIRIIVADSIEEENPLKKAFKI